MAKTKQEKIIEIITKEKKLANFNILLLNEYLNFNTKFTFTDKIKGEVKNYIFKKF